MKEKLRHIILWFIKAGIAGCIAIFILSAVAVFYDYTGVHVTSKTGATDYTWEPNQWRATMTEGFAWMRIDQNGYNNAYRASSRDIDVLLMGSSHMEAINIGPEQNTGYRLNELLTDSYVYNIGISGHTIYHCVNNLSNAVQTYQPSRWVVMETDSVALDVEKMRSVIAGDYAHIPSYDNGTLYYLQKYVPAAKTLYNNLSDWHNQEKTTSIGMNIAETAEAANENTAPAEYTEALGQFLNMAASSMDNDRQLLIFYHPKTLINTDGSYATENDEMVRIFAQACEDAGIIFIDMTPDFKKMYEERNILAHGFINTAVGTGHLNSHGHEAIARKLAEKMGESQNE